MPSRRHRRGLPLDIVRTRLIDAFHRLWRELAKFGVIGAISFVIDLGGYNLLIAGPMAHKVTTAKIISGAVATAFAWVGNRFWTFRHRHNRPVHHEVFLFFAVNGVALAISAAWVAFAHYVLHAHGTLMLNVHAFIGIGLGTIFRFWAYRNVVFANEDVDGDGPEAVQERDSERNSANTAG
ncbi:putative flippase GtrA [Branchiibius hedensis]|uniref:Flippase GtrA (Transmembrane translocase of bactoprenol-linked glucose) n=1 Tax=Branchiibius hedensis TaxID=672460 RepID=A0A2Y8ZR93_9MICO|nr:putative flippase GtrA [Branchiibius hedensis]SSA34881.1 Putative flippase GtrA (transmembrane translocase of bactoprenol-linked glucose) [Branchiibius hedensis]